MVIRLHSYNQTKTIMKTIQVLTEGVKGGSTKIEKKGRCKIILTDKEDRPEYIEIDNFSGLGDSYQQRNEPIIKMSFKDNKEWYGTMEDLKNILGNTPYIK